MGTINIYQGISDEYKTIKGNGCVRDLILEAMPDFDLNHAVIINAGEQIKPDYILKDNDIIFIRVIPGVTTVIAVVGCVCAAVALGAAIYSAVETNKAQKQMEKAQKQAKAMAEKITQLPFLVGASNRSALGYNIPYVMGSTYNVPYKLVNGFYTISGSNGAEQFWNANFVVGFNNAIVQDVSIGTTKIKSSNSSITVPGQSAIVPVLTESSSPYYFDSDSTYYASENRIEIKYKDEMSLSGVNEKVKAINYGNELDTNIPVTKQLEKNTYKVDVCVKFDGLRKFTESWEGKNVDIHLEWCNDGATWHDAGYISTGNVNARKTVRFAKTLQFAPADCVDKNLELRLTRTTPLEESNSQETCYLCYMNCWQYDAQKSTTSNIVVCRPLENPWRERTTRIGLRVIANDTTKDNLDQINCNVFGKARIWNGAQWSVEKYPTRNPAAWVLEIMTTEVHPHSRYKDEEIDLEALGRLYEYCERNNFYCDGLVIDDTKKRDILSNILAESNATMFMDHLTGKWTFAIEEKQTTPVALLTEQNIKSVTISKTFERKPYAKKTTFTNRDSWAVDTFYQTKNGMIDSATAYGEKKVITEVAPKYITTHAHAYRFTHRQIAKQILQPREIVVQVGVEGDYYPLYAKILIQMSQMRVGLSSGLIHSVVVNNNKLEQFTTSDLCVFADSTQRYGVIIQAQNDTGKQHLFCEVMGKGSTKTLTLKKPIPVEIIPEYGNQYSFGCLDENGSFKAVTNEMMIYGAKQNANGWELTLRDYNDAIFEEGPVPEYKTNLTTPKETGVQLPISQSQLPGNIATKDDIQDVIDDLQTGNVPIGKPDAPRTIIAVASENGIQLACALWSDGLRNTLKKVIWKITKEDGTTDSFETSETSSVYRFNRNKDGYPEAENLANWRVVASVENMYGKTSEDSAPGIVDVKSYGTWQLSTPTVNVRESQRVVSLTMTQPARADGRRLYGIVNHTVKIKRLSPPADIKFYKPATSSNPWELETNYKDGDGEVLCGNSYSQTLPLVGQETNLPTDTTYAFEVTAHNEAGSSEATVINGTAHATSIKDIVESAIGTDQLSKGAVTADKIYVKMLSAIQSNLGYITGGIFEGTENNRWALSTIEKEDGSVRYEGAFRVGGVDEFFEVEPYNIENGIPKDYHVTFKAGNFEITAMASNINGTLYVMERADSLDRTKITPNGTYYQHRETSTSKWVNIASSNVNGVASPQLFSDSTLFITNQDMAVRRREGYDIGNKYLSPASKVYHFDTDVFDQNGTNDLTITDAEIEGGHNLVGSETESDDINFTPAILAIAPYSTIGRSLYGKYKLEASTEICSVFTLDFWLQYIYAENQIIFDVGNTSDRIKLIVASAECYFEKGPTGGDEIPFNAEIKESRMYNPIPIVECTFFDRSAEVPFCEIVPGQTRFESIAVKEFDADFIYYMLQKQRAEVFNVVPITVNNYYDFLERGLWEKTLPFNDPAEAHSFLKHEGQTESETVELSDMNVSFHSNEWLHIGVIADEQNIKVALNYTDCKFKKYGAIPEAVSLILNKDSNSFLLDELLIDTTTAEELPMFYEHTTNRIPWANLTASEDYFVLTVEDLKNFKTNIFDSQIFKDKVTAIVQSLIK